MLKESKEKSDFSLTGQELEKQKIYSLPLSHSGGNHNQSEVAITRTEKNRRPNWSIHISNPNCSAFMRASSNTYSGGRPSQL